MITQKQRLEEAYNIHGRFHNYLGYLVCDGEEDLLALRKLVKKLQREAVNKYKKENKWNLNLKPNARYVVVQGLLKPLMSFDVRGVAMFIPLLRNLPLVCLFNQCNYMGPISTGNVGTLFF